VGKYTVLAVGLNGKDATAVARDVEGRQLGPAVTRFSRGLVHVTPVAGAFGYLLTPKSPPSVELKSDRRTVVPGEKVTVRGKVPRVFDVPPKATPGTLAWHHADGAWLDFEVVPLVDVRVHESLKVYFSTFTGESKKAHGPGAWEVMIAPNLPLSDAVQVKLGTESQTVYLIPDWRLVGEIDSPQHEEVRKVPLVVSAGGLRYERAWWVKAEDAIRSVEPISEKFQGGECLRKGKERPFAGNTGGHAHWIEYACGGVSKRCLFMHPPYMGGVGYAFALLEPVDLPREWPAAFRCLIGKGDGSDPGDGILFRVAVVDAKGKETIVAEKQWIKHAWTPLEADLGRWEGQRVRIKLVADVGPADNSAGDWAGWAELKIESRKPVLTASIHDSPVTLARVPGPHPVDNLTVADLRKARRAVLHFQGKGLGHASPYISVASLNDVRLGELPEAGGDEVRGAWADARLEIPATAIAATIRSPSADFGLNWSWPTGARRLRTSPRPPTRSRPNGPTAKAIACRSASRLK
jgi:hypothetical protein